MRAASHRSANKTNTNNNVVIMSEPWEGKRAISSEEDLKQELESLKTKRRKLEEQLAIYAATEGNNNRDHASDGRAPDCSNFDEGYTSSDAANSPKSPHASDRQRKDVYAPLKHSKDSKAIKATHKAPSRPGGSKDNIPRNEDIILTNNRPSAPPINIILLNMAKGLDSVFQNGLPKEERYRLLEKYKTPSNCTLMKTPILNPEVIPLMNEKAKKRDSIMFKHQDQLSAGMAAIAKGVTLASKSGKSSTQRSPDFTTAMEHINRGLHLLADLHYDYTRVRRIVCTPANSRLKSFLVAKLSHRHQNFYDINHLFKRDDTVFGRRTGNMIKEFLRQ